MTRINIMSQTESNNNEKFTVKYRDTLKRCQMRWRATERGKEKCRIRSLKYYYRKKGLYHPELNPEGEIEGKYKKTNIEL